MLSEAYKKMVLKKMAMFVLTGRPNEHYLISNAEWQLVSNFTTVLEPFRDVTQLLCQSKQVTASTALLLVRAALEMMKEHEEVFKKVDSSLMASSLIICNIIR